MSLEQQKYLFVLEHEFFKEEQFTKLSFKVLNVKSTFNFAGNQSLKQDAGLQRSMNSSRVKAKDFLHVSSTSNNQTIKVININTNMLLLLHYLYC